MTSTPTGTPIAAPSGALMQALQEATSRIDTELNRRHSAPMTMSAGGSDKLAIVQTELLADIGTDAVKIARRSGVSTVDERHVDEAAARLGVSENRNALITVANNVGGILSGAGLAGLYQILFTKGPHSNLEIAIAFIFTVVGAACMVWSATLTFLKDR